MPALTCCQSTGSFPSRPEYSTSRHLYINNVVVAADTEKEFVRLLCRCVAAFDRHRIRCKLSKCVISAWSISLMGHILSARGMKIADDKREEASPLPTPLIQSSCDRRWAS